MSDWETKWKGLIWVSQQSEQPNGAVFEKVSRSPGIRLIFIRDGKVLLNRESRNELDGKVDHRLPGGKVFDTNEEYQKFLGSNIDILDASRLSATKEALEEVGIIVDPSRLEYLYTDILGATCTWDLLYWACEDFSYHDTGAQFHETEADEIRGAVWVPIPEACSMVLDKEQFSESRSAIALLTVARNKGYIKI